MGVASTIASVFTAVDRYTRPLRKMQRATRSFATRAQMNIARVERSFQRLQRSVNRTLGVVGRLGLGFGALLIAEQIATANIELDKSLQSLQAITGVTGKAFIPFRQEIDKVSKSQKIFAADTAAAFELVGSAKPELLENAEALGKVSEAAIILGKAGKLEVTDSVTSLTVSMNQFGASAGKASEFVDILATAQQKGSGTISFLSEAMVNAGGTSRAFGNSFADTVAILEGFAKAGVPASESGTQLAGILSKLSRVQNKDFNPQFTKATDIIDNLAKANLTYTELIKLTDVRGAKWITTIINQNDVVQKLTGNLNDVGNAQRQADIQTDSLRTKIDELSASFKNQVTSTSESNIAISATKNILTFLADNMGLLIGTIAILVGGFILLKTILLISKVALLAYNIVLGVSTVLMRGNLFALRGNAAAMIAAAIATKVITAAQWLMSASTLAVLGPILLVIAAVAGLTFLIVKMVNKWDEWGAALSLFIPVLGFIISFIISLRKNWDMVKDAFTEGGIMSGLLAIGKVILDAILMPVQQLLEILSNIPIVGEFAMKGAEQLEKFRTSLGLETESKAFTLGEGEKGRFKAVNPAAARQESLERSITESKQNTSITISDETGRANVNSDNDIVPVILTPTFAF